MSRHRPDRELPRYRLGEPSPTLRGRVLEACAQDRPSIRLTALWPELSLAASIVLTMVLTSAAVSVPATPGAAQRTALPPSAPPAGIAALTSAYTKPEADPEPKQFSVESRLEDLEILRREMGDPPQC